VNVRSAGGKYERASFCSLSECPLKSRVFVVMYEAEIMPATRTSTETRADRPTNALLGFFGPGSVAVEAGLAGFGALGSSVILAMEKVTAS
jgi:hypothetical protein